MVGHALRTVHVFVLLAFRAKDANGVSIIEVLEVREKCFLNMFFG